MSSKKSNSKVDVEAICIDEINHNQNEVILEISSETKVELLSDLVKSPTSGKPTKQQIIIDLLSREGGACLEEMIEATNWQKHSIRGVISGSLKKKLGLKVQSRITGNVRSYFIEAVTNNAEVR
ncbi:MAG: DUF3489 domain-containing protein [Caulobacterales bacterium]|nr:DUF3489 domain-containing protein [Caulobacterales bacterium]MCA0372787.1 DUF3489 domain-containing protein [Pseudomonadota bacterium]